MAIGDDIGRRLDVPLVREVQRIEALHSTNSNVACNAVWSLEWTFPAQSDRVIPELKTAAERKDNLGGYARTAIAAIRRKRIALSMKAAPEIGAASGGKTSRGSARPGGPRPPAKLGQDRGGFSENPFETAFGKLGGN